MDPSHTDFQEKEPIMMFKSLRLVGTGGERSFGTAMFFGILVHDATGHPEFSKTHSPCSRFPTMVQTLRERSQRANFMFIPHTKFIPWGDVLLLRSMTLYEVAIKAK